jgi:hypothetical protein
MFLAVTVHYISANNVEALPSSHVFMSDIRATPEGQAHE